MKIRKATLSVNHTSIAESKISPAVSSQGMWEKGGRKNGRRRVQRVAIFKVVVVRLQTIGGWRRCGPFSGLCWMDRWIPGRPNRCSCCRTRSRRLAKEDHSKLTTIVVRVFFAVASLAHALLATVCMHAWNLLAQMLHQDPKPIPVFPASRWLGWLAGWEETQGRRDVGHMESPD